MNYRMIDLDIEEITNEQLDDLILMFEKQGIRTGFEKVEPHFFSECEEFDFTDDYSEVVADC